MRLRPEGFDNGPAHRTERDGDISTLQAALDKFLRRHGLLRMSRESLVAVLWPEVVGPWYAAHTRVLYVDKGVVTVRCDSAARAQQLQLDSEPIIQALNERIGPRTVKELRPSSGGISRAEAEWEDTAPLPWPSRTELDAIELERSERSRAEGVLAEVTEPALRAVAMSVLLRQRKLQRWLRAHGYLPCRGCGGLIEPGRSLCKGCDPGDTPAQGSPESFEWDDIERQYRKPKRATVRSSNHDGGSDLQGED